jgi:hypothetical protein
MYRPRISRHALLILFVCAGVTCAALFSPKGSGQTKGASFDQKISQSLRSYDALRLNPADTELKVRQTGRLTLDTSAGTFTLRLRPNDVRADSYRAIAVRDGGQIVELPREPSRTFEGSVEGSEGSQARFTIDRGTIEGMIIAHGEKFFVEPAAHYTDSAAPGDFLFYRESDVIPANPLECGVETLAEKVNEEFSRSTSSSSITTPRLAVLSPAREAEIVTDSDFEFFQANGSSAANANNEILSIINQVSGVYQSEIGLSFKVVFQRVFSTSSDPYDAATMSDLLAQVKTQWSGANAPTSNRDVVHMWTGRDLDGFTTGLAYSQVTVNGVPSNGVVCRFQDFAVGVSERQTLAPQKYIVPAHEIGHNFSAQHPEQVGHPECALTIMSGIVMTNTILSFCQFSRDEITNYINANGSCLATATAPPPTLQFNATDYRVAEGAGSVQLTVTRANGTGAATVDFQTVDGTANDRGDYTTALGTIRFANGETTKTFNVFITDDAYGEGLEAFQVQLLNATGATLGTPSAATVTIVSNESANGPNPVKDPDFNPSFFARQHYIDFLNREPDTSGLNFWTGQTTNCGNRDLLVCRVNVSGAFFLSIEYQETGFYAIRAQRVAFGRRSDNASTRMGYRELIFHQRFVGEGVVVGQAGYEQLLAANKLAYASAVVARSDFAARFPQANADSYVDALFASAGVTPTPTERQDAINAYNSSGGGASSRAGALRSVSDSGSVRNAEIRTAFVLLQYHGYMRRDPDEGGYQFWLGKLNQFGGNYVSAEMVKAFITSAEYQQRFGQ